MMSTTNRVHPGVPTGGQYATQEHAEADITLSEDLFGGLSPRPDADYRPISSVHDGEDFSHRTMLGTDLRHARARGANFRSADLNGANRPSRHRLTRSQLARRHPHQGSRWVRTSAELAEVRARRVPRISQGRLASPDTVW